MVVRGRRLHLVSLASRKVQYSYHCSLYIAPVSDIAIAHHVSIHQYADDIQTYIAIQPQCLDSLSQLISCTDDITNWFLENGFLLNPSKTEVVVF